MLWRRGKWTLSPAYDITFAYDTTNQWLKAYQMLINGKSNNIRYEDLIAAGKKMGLNKQKCNWIIGEVEEIASKMPEYFEIVGIKEQTCDAIMQVVRDIWIM